MPGRPVEAGAVLAFACKLRDRIEALEARASSQGHPEGQSAITTEPAVRAREEKEEKS